MGRGAARGAPGGAAEEAAPVIRVAGVTKRYRRVSPGDQLRTLKSALVDRSLVSRLDAAHSILALDGVDLTVGKGEAVGVVGGNGSGKSTLLKIVAGILQPTFGSVEIDGRTAALIELGAGFHPEISGRENVYVNGALLGMTRREIDRRYDDIVAFSGLADFMEEPVKNYSSGMYVRLGFAVAVHTEPDVLLVDEVLSVGDESFAHRSLTRIEKLLAEGRSLLFVSHSLDLVERLCDRVLWLDRGKPRLVGGPRRVIDAYRQAVAEAEGSEHRAEQAALETAAEGEEEGGSDAGETEEQRPDRWGSREAEIVGVRLLGGDGREVGLVESGSPVTFELRVRSREPLDDFVFGVAVSTPRGIECWGTNTDLAGFVPGRLEGEATVRLVCPDLRLAPGEYLLDAAVHARDGAPYDYRRRALGFTVASRRRGVGVYFPEHRWEVSGGVRWEGDDRAP